jgi:hypothetical protein
MGLSPAGSPGYGCGDDPYYINQLAAVMASVPMAYQSYFLQGDQAPLLLNNSDALAAYGSHFGAGGNRPSGWLRRS